MRSPPIYSRNNRVAATIAAPLPRTGAFSMPSSRVYKTIGLPLFAIAAANLIWFVASAFIEASQTTGAGPIVYKGARIHTASGPVIERGVMIVLKGKILDVGSEDDVKIPKNAQV